MTNEELRQAIADANHMLRQTSKDARNYADLLAHLNGLLAEQRRRAALPTQVAPIGPLYVQPVVVQPTWVPNAPWEPLYRITCGDSALDA